MRDRESRELVEELLEQAEETRRLIARFSDESESWRGKALLACLKNQQALLEAFGFMLRAGPSAPRAAEAEAPQVPAPTTPVVGEVDGDRARAIVEEFDNRDHMFDRGLEKLNSWIAGGRGALPFQKRENHAYLNRTANSEAMIARIETELMSREGFTVRLGRLKVDGLEGEILVYGKIQ
ncbi:MAG TPA: hypothetical protein VFF73_30155 [Planctomycetota bacterium]|nr:hypothetical protein [Planctomycetota bacterium]